MNTNILIILTLFVTTNAFKIPRHTHLNALAEGNFLANGSRIVGGANTVISKYPHQISIQEHGFHFCGGSIISDEWIITAGHCVVQSENKTLTIRSGSTLTSEGGIIDNVTEIIIHEEYYVDEFGAAHNDVALIRVTFLNLNGRTRRAIKLNDVGETVRPGTRADVTGWGIIKEGQEDVPWVLQKVKVPILSSTRCKDLLGSIVQKGEICAGYEEGGRSSCQGDSGGSLMVRKILVGIVSYGQGCARPRKPGVYADVAYFRDWIRNKTRI
ncbi:trypsin 3A1-like isoform X2 [Belonocnema kinseyi]|uniref:trypsin 3A1-like isoform X2 n=1 Tax=Belonocnema kinseyi TaxID=2817044 RepID=UPI00143DD736|nr:trypsin 3A1-like isoform X2 [Belonocnema kinseyi]